MLDTGHHSEVSILRFKDEKQAGSPVLGDARFKKITMIIGHMSQAKVIYMLIRNFSRRYILKDLINP